MRRLAVCGGRQHGFCRSASDLPTLPIPPLVDTLDRFRASMRGPLYGDHDAQTTLAAAAMKFAEDAGPRVQRALEAYAVSQANRGNPSYIMEWWDDMYMEGRWPVCINNNPAFHLVDESTDKMDPCDRMARFLAATVRWWDNLGDPEWGICTRRLPMHFGTTRIPKHGRDEWITTHDSSHVAVACNGSWYKVALRTADGACSTASIATALRDIKARSRWDTGAMEGLGVLTTLGRDEWATHREAILQASDIELLHGIEDAFLAIALDDPYEYTSPLGMFLHGGEEAIRGHRWFDKHQIIINDDGQLGANFEHSFADGAMWIQWVMGMWGDFTSQGDLDRLAPAAPWSQINYVIPPSVERAIVDQQRTYRDTIADVSLGELYFPNSGKDALKALGASPDAVVQMAYQIAYFTQHGTTPNTYESCSTATFTAGRTETIRSATEEMAEVARTFYTPQRRHGTLANAIKAACNRHVVVAKEAQAGLGVDRHLLALRKIAIAEGDNEALEFLNHPLVVNSTHWTLSTSQVPCPQLQGIAFGAVVPDGYGLGYLIGKDGLRVTVSSYNSNPHTDPLSFHNNLRRALEVLPGAFRENSEA